MPTPARHLVLFAREPRLGAVKRRLARDVGRQRALAFYRQTLFTVMRRTLGDPRWTPWLAVTPDRAACAPALRRPGSRLIGQGRGDLGARMARVFRTLPPGPVVIVGSDIPALDSEHIASAFAALGRADAVLGPSGDGGYWLIGLRRRAPPPPTLFRGVRWSSPYAYADTGATFPRAYKVATLVTLEDVDDGGDYERLFRSPTDKEPAP
ncbi:MAG: TIGR04282 family arsenosugar biosynthesis glycosyltransferase [Marivibrio sp.]|uniref:TIGR04282 family arsenosugar biosynthesis glycosyltransferase n=1 Tax=Marivibrio sp. TaxID=2039719 RepID=UPI0032ED5304